MKLFKMSIGCFFVLLLILVYSCKKDLNSGLVGNSSASRLEINDDVAVHIQFDMEVSNFIAPLDKADVESLTEAERALTIPKPMGCSVNEMINKDGTVDADIEMVRFEGMPVFPDRTVGLEVAPSKMATKRIEVRNGTSSHYNSEGEKLFSSSKDGTEVLFLKELVENMHKGERLTAEQMDLVFEGYRQAGFNFVQSEKNPDNLILTQEIGDGSSTKLVYNKRIGSIIGRANFDNAGELSNSSAFIYDPETQELTGHWFRVFYVSPFSGVKMSINKVSKISNFNLTTNI